MILEKIECLDEYKLSMKSIYGHTDLSLSQKKYLTENDPYQKNDQEIVFYKINITGSENAISLSPMWLKIVCWRPECLGQLQLGN